MSNLPHYLVRMPNWLGDVVMAIPALRALRQQHPCHLSLLLQPHLLELAKALQLADEYIALPPKSWRYYWQLTDLCKHGFDAEIVFANSERSDIEARIINASKRYGMQASRRRWLLNCVYLQQDCKRAHQSLQLGEFLQAVGLLDSANLDLKPCKLPELQATAYMAAGELYGMVCGTENMPSKRWPISAWVELGQQILHARPEAQILLLGTARDLPICSQVAAQINNSRLHNIAGSTSLLELCTTLQQLQALICNDTGAMHLANALGTKVVAIFGPTNPLATAPIFAAKKIILQPANCPAAGGADIAGVSVSEAMNALNTITSGAV